MVMTIEHEILLQHSMGEIRRLAKLYNIKIGSRRVIDIIDNIVVAREKAKQERRATARQKAIVAALHG